MILKRYGTQYQSVVPNFDAHAMNEIGFQRDHSLSLATDEFEARYARVDERLLTATGEGMVQSEAEQALLTSLHEQLMSLSQSLNSGKVLVVENEQGRDYPKLREKVTTLVIEHENKLHFQRTVDPPLRIGVYEPRQS